MKGWFMMNKINKDIFISEERDCYYLLYANHQYILFNDTDKGVISTEIKNVDLTPVNVIDLLDELDENFDESDLPNELRILYMKINDYSIFYSLFNDLADVYYYSKDEDNDSYKLERLDAIDNDTINERILKLSISIEQSIIDEKISGLYNSFKNRKGIKKAQRDLGNYLNTDCGIILRINSHDLYKLDEINKGYNSITVDEIIGELTGIFNEKNLFKTTDVENAVDFISERLTPEYNIVNFKNGLYDMKQHQLIKPDKPIFTLIESPFDYNPNAKPKYMIDFLNSTFERDTPEETEEEIKGIKQLIGYLFTSGNIKNILIFFTGIGGGGKGTFATIIAELFKGKTTQLDFSKVEKDTHATSILIGKHLNIVRENQDRIVEDNTTYKLLSGNDPIDVNPKNQTPYELPSEEVPKSIMNANNLPNFRNPDKSIIQRFVVVEFRKIFRTTDKDIPDLAKIIIESKEDMEWLIYESLNEYKQMMESKEDFILRISESETLELLFKHSNPLNYLIRKLIGKHDPEALDDEISISDETGETSFTTPYIIADELNQLMVYLSEQEGIQIPFDKKTGKVSSRRLLNAIRDEFDLFDYYLKTSRGNEKKYSTINKKINGKQQRVYPELVKTEKYDKYLKEMEQANKHKTQKHQDKTP